MRKGLVLDIIGGKMNKEEALKKIYELHDKCNDELASYYDRLEKQGLKRYGLDGPKTEIQKKYDRMIRDVILQINK